MGLEGRSYLLEGSIDRSSVLLFLAYQEHILFLEWLCIFTEGNWKKVKLWRRIDVFLPFSLLLYMMIISFYLAHQLVNI